MAENTNNNEAKIAKTGDTVQKDETTRSWEHYTTPAVDIYEEENGLYVIADLPGAKKDGINVDVDQQILTIKAERNPKASKEGHRLKEYGEAVYYRQFKLGESIDREHIKADYNNGVLNLHLPFAEAAKPKRIEVNIA